MGLREAIRSDLARVTDDRKMYTPFIKWLFAPSFKAMVLARLAIHASRNGRLGRMCARFLWRMNVSTSSCYISFDAEIGNGLLLPHPTGVVIGDGVKIGSGVTLYQNVTLGRANAHHSAYPTVSDGATVYAGAVIVGRVTIGPGAVVGANAVVVCDVPPRAVVGGIPAKQIGWAKQANAAA